MKKAAGTSESLIYRTRACLNPEDLKPNIQRFQTPQNFVCIICPVFVHYTVRLVPLHKKVYGGMKEYLLSSLTSVLDLGEE
jgi:hypothetical protein